MVDAYAERKAEEVMRDTWGHMDANPGTRYRGEIVYAEGAFGGERVILASEFGNAGFGPWFYQGIHGWLCQQETEPGRLYQFKGTYRLSHDGRHIFDGIHTVMDIPKEII